MWYEWPMPWMFFGPIMMLIFFRPVHRDDMVHDARWNASPS